ncbi:MAG TPA: polysaccharide biosynthesis tyrosine autokinase [Burkholderiaceae bacterium]
MSIPSDHNLIAPLHDNRLVVGAAPMLAAPAMTPYEEDVHLTNYYDMLVDSRWLILKIALLVSLCGVAYAFLSKPVYEATMLIHVEEDKPNTSKNMLGDISSLFDVKAAAISEMELLNSRMVITRAVDNLGLYINVRPKYFPVVGEWFARRQSSTFQPGIFGYGGYVWGAEKIDVATFFAPEYLQNQQFVLTVLPDGKYRLHQEKWNFDAVGEVGNELSVETGKGKLELSVKHIDAAPGAQFLLSYRPKLAAIQDVQSAMTVVEKGKQSGIIGVTLESDDPKAAHDILTEIGNEYIHQNVARKLEEAEKSLKFLDDQLPDLKRKVEASEAEYYQFRNAHGTIDLPEESKLSLQQSVALKAKRLELQQKKEELLISFTPNHPIVIGINNQIREMDAQIASTDGHIKQLPILEQDLLRLNREMKVNSELYSALLNTAQQLRMVKAGKVSNVRLIDAPMMPETPARPNRPKIIGLSVAAGLLLGLSIAFFRKISSRRIEDPRRLEKVLGARVVYTTIPHSEAQRGLPGKRHPEHEELPLLAHADPGDIAIESLRNFRTVFQNANARFRNNVVLISGPTPGVGKSFVSMNFAAVMAASGKRVLLVDADLRKGNLHRHFGLARDRGLSEVIRGSCAAKDAIHNGIHENLDFLSTGALPPNPSEFLLHRNFGELMRQLSAEYDYVLLDPPPILAVSDTLVIAAHAGAIFILARANVTSESEINESIKRFNQAGIAPEGILFNDAKVRSRSYGAYHYPQSKSLGYSS